MFRDCGMGKHTLRIHQDNHIEFASMYTDDHQEAEARLRIISCIYGSLACDTMVGTPSISCTSQVVTCIYCTVLK